MWVVRTHLGSVTERPDHPPRNRHGPADLRPTMLSLRKRGLDAAREVGLACDQTGTPELVMEFLAAAALGRALAHLGRAAWMTQAGDAHLRRLGQGVALACALDVALQAVAPAVAQSLVERAKRCGAQPRPLTKAEALAVAAAFHKAVPDQVRHLLSWDHEATGRWVVAAVGAVL